jgi:ATP-dependent Clp protease ATP-binding subunit ClpA
VITYKPLEPDRIREIVDVQLARLSKHLREQEIEVELTGAAKEALSKEGYDPEYGARPLKRVIQKRIQNLLAEAILAGRLGPGSRASIDWRAGRFELASSKPTPEAASTR